MVIRALKFVGIMRCSALAGSPLILGNQVTLLQDGALLRSKTALIEIARANYSRLQLGFSGAAKNEQGTSATHLKRNEALADFSVDYGLPGKPGYAYSRPFERLTCVRLR